MIGEDELSGHDGLVANGYVWTGIGRCRDCGKTVLWYRTPNQKHVPMDPDSYALHFATCGKANRNKSEFSAEDLAFLESLKILDSAEIAKPKKVSIPGQSQITFEEVE